jgi:hypothetical protein
MRCWVNPGAIGNNRRRVDTRRPMRARMKHGGDSRVHRVRIRADQRRRRTRLSRGFVQYNGGRMRLRQLGLVARVGYERDRARASTRQRRYVIDERVRIAAQLATEPNGQFPEGDSHSLQLKGFRTAEALYAQ